MTEAQLKNLVKHLNDCVQGNEELLEEVVQEARKEWNLKQEVKGKANQVLQDLWAVQKRKRK